MLMGSYCPVTGKLHDSKYQPALALTAFSGPSILFAKGLSQMRSLDLSILIHRYGSITASRIFPIGCVEGCTKSGGNQPLDSASVASFYEWCY